MLKFLGVYIFPKQTENGIHELAFCFCCVCRGGLNASGRRFKEMHGNNEINLAL